MNDLANLTVIYCPEQENIYQCWRTESLPPSLRERVEEEELDEYEETGVLPFENTINFLSNLKHNQRENQNSLRILLIKFLHLV